MSNPAPLRVYLRFTVLAKYKGHGHGKKREGGRFELLI